MHSIPETKISVSSFAIIEVNPDFGKKLAACYFILMSLLKKNLSLTVIKFQFKTIKQITQFAHLLMGLLIVFLNREKVPVNFLSLLQAYQIQLIQLKVFGWFLMINQQW